MKQRLFLLVIVFLSGFTTLYLSGCSSSGSNPTSTTSNSSYTTTTQTFSVTGRVCFADFNHGIANVLVNINSPDEKIATTDALGYFSMSGLNNGTYSLTASKENWIIPSGQVTIDSSSAVYNFTATLEDWEIMPHGGAHGIPEVTLRKIIAKQADDVMVVGDTNLYLSQDSGGSWTSISSPANNIGGSTKNMDLAYELLDENGYLNYYDGSWHINLGPFTLEAHNIYPVMASTYWISDGITVEAVGANGKLYHTEDILSSPVVWTESGNGRTDVTGVSTKAFAFEVPFPTQLNYVFFSESNGSVEGTVNGNWSQPYNLPLSPGTAINDVQFISNDTKLHWCAVGDSGSIYFFNFAIGLDPSTASIESTTSGIPMKLNGVYRDYNYIYVCGEHGLFLRRPINESTW